MYDDEWRQGQKKIVSQWLPSKNWLQKTHPLALHEIIHKQVFSSIPNPK